MTRQPEALSRPFHVEPCPRVFGAVGRPVGHAFRRGRYKDTYVCRHCGRTAKRDELVIDTDGTVLGIRDPETIRKVELWTTPKPRA